MELHITPEPQARIDPIAARSGMSASEVIADALENGHSRMAGAISRQGRKSIAAADRGEFAGPADLERVRNKYRPNW